MNKRQWSFLLTRIIPFRYGNTFNGPGPTRRLYKGRFLEY